MSQDSVVNIAVTRQQAGRSGIRNPAGANTSFIQNAQTSSWVHPASYSVGTGVRFRGVKRTGREADRFNLVPT
jgi:hypothetical protein